LHLIFADKEVPPSKHYNPNLFFNPRQALPYSFNFLSLALLSFHKYKLQNIHIIHGSIEDGILAKRSEAFYLLLYNPKSNERKPQSSAWR